MSDQEEQFTPENRYQGRGMSRQYSRQMFSIRIPGNVYSTDWQTLHGFLASYSDDGCRFSNSVLVRVCVHAFMRLLNDAKAAGPEAVDKLGRDMADAAHGAARRKRGPDKARSTHINQYERPSGA